MNTYLKSFSNLGISMWLASLFASLDSAETPCFFSKFGLATTWGLWGAIFAIACCFWMLESRSPCGDVVCCSTLWNEWITLESIHNLLSPLCIALDSYNWNQNIYCRFSWTDRISFMLVTRRKPLSILLSIF